MDKDNKEKAFLWQKEQTTQYLLRFMNSTGVPDAINRATKATGETTTEYIKTSLVNRLRDEGFLSGEVVLNLNKKKHAEKIKKLEKYIEEEKRKQKIK